MTAHIDSPRDHWRLVGEAHGNAKLKASDILVIRAAKGSLRSIGKDYGVTLVAIWKIKKRKSWKHIR